MIFLLSSVSKFGEFLEIQNLGTLVHVFHFREILFGNAWTRSVPMLCCTARSFSPMNCYTTLSPTSCSVRQRKAFPHFLYINSMCLSVSELFCEYLHENYRICKIILVCCLARRVQYIKEKYLVTLPL